MNPRWSFDYSPSKHSQFQRANPQAIELPEQTIWSEEIFFASTQIGPASSPKQVDLVVAPRFSAARLTTSVDFRARLARL